MSTQIITVKLRRLGKKRVHVYPIEVLQQPTNLRELLMECVRSEVHRFNTRTENKNMLSFLSTTVIQEKATTGKIGVGVLFNTKKEVLETAIENVLLAFKDGVFVVFIDAIEIKDIFETIHLDEKSEITFMRLTFLTGTFW